MKDHHGDEGDGDDDDDGDYGDDGGDGGDGDGDGDFYQNKLASSKMRKLKA